MNLFRKPSAALAVFLYATSVFGAEPIVYTDRAEFDQAFPSQRVDYFTNSEYRLSQNNQEMSAVENIVFFEPTAHLQQNYVLADPDNSEQTVYCAGCNGSFAIHLSDPSNGNEGGTAGFAVGIHNNGLFDDPVFFQEYLACVFLSSGAFFEYELPNPNLEIENSLERAFWGIGAPAPELIARVHFGGTCGPDGMGSTRADGQFSIDNLAVADQALFADGFE